MSASERITATTEGPAWSAAAHGWAAHWTAFGAPAREAVALAAGIEADTSARPGLWKRRVLRSGRRTRRPGERHRRGRRDSSRSPGRGCPTRILESVPSSGSPWPDDSFDVVTGFNVFQFAADFVAALTEARRVTRSGGPVAICNSGRVEDCEVHAISVGRLVSRARGAPWRAVPVTSFRDREAQRSLPFRRLRVKVVARSSPALRRMHPEVAHRDQQGTRDDRDAAIARVDLNAGVRQLRARHRVKARRATIAASRS